MPNYRISICVRAIGGYRLRQGGLAVGAITLSSKDESTYEAKIAPVFAETAQEAYEQAKLSVEHLLEYYALLGDDAAFITNGLEGVKGRNLDLEASPVPDDQPPPPFESIGGVVMLEGQEAIAQLTGDDDGAKRRKGWIVVHHVTDIVAPGVERFNELSSLYLLRLAVPRRVSLALSMIHDAACAKEYANAFAQTFIALEVLMTEHRTGTTVLDAYCTRTNAVNSDARKQAIRDGMEEVLAAAGLTKEESARIIGYASQAQSISHADAIGKYLSSLGIAMERPRIRTWLRMRGALVHAAESDAAERAEMASFRSLVRDALMRELRRAARQA